MIERVVVELDHHGRLGAAIKNARHLARAAQAAARTLALRCALLRDDFDLHV